MQIILRKSLTIFSDQYHNQKKNRLKEWLLNRKSTNWKIKEQNYLICLNFLERKRNFIKHLADGIEFDINKNYLDQKC